MWSFPGLVTKVLQCGILVLIQPTDCWILIGYWELLGGRDSSVGIATRYDLDCPEFESMWECGFPWPPRSTPRPTQLPVQGVLCHSQGRGAKHSPPSSTGLRIGVSCTSASPLCLHRRAISIFDLLRYIQYERSVSLIVCFAPCVGKKSRRMGVQSRTRNLLLCFAHF
jgi:hypothetical protein